MQRPCVDHAGIKSAASPILVNEHPMPSPLPWSARTGAGCCGLLPGRQAGLADAAFLPNIMVPGGLNGQTAPARVRSRFTMPNMSALAWSLVRNTLHGSRIGFSDEKRCSIAALSPASWNAGRSRPPGCRVGNRWSPQRQVTDFCTRRRQDEPKAPPHCGSRQILGFPPGTGLAHAFPALHRSRSWCRHVAIATFRVF